MGAKSQSTGENLVFSADFRALAEDGREPTLETRPLCEGRIFRAEELVVGQPDGSLGKRDLVYHSGGVCVLAHLADDRVVLVRQYRKAVEDFLWELPAGKLELNEDPLEAAKRELSEETGFTARSWSALGILYPTPGYCTERIYLYAAEELEGGTPHPDEHEYLSVVLRPLNELVDEAINGTIRDAKTALGLLRYWLQREGGKKR